MEGNKEVHSPAQTKQDDNTDQTTQQDTYSALNNQLSPKVRSTDDASPKQPSTKSPQQCSPTLTITDQSSLIHSPRPESPKHLSPKVRGTTDHASPEQPSTTSPNTEQPSLENHRAENKMTWAEVVERMQKNHTRDTKQKELLPLVRLCPKCHMTHLPCDCSSTFWNCGYCDAGLSYYFRDKIR
jgi:hypothetical protein